MIVLEKDAMDYGCCVTEKPCMGQRCMAWQWFVPKKAKPKTPKAEYGYCGMVTHQSAAEQ